MRIGRTGMTLAELLVALSVAAVLATAVPTSRALVERASLARSARAAAAHLGRARMAAVARRERLRVTVAPDGVLLLVDSDGEVVERTPLAGDGFLALDSLRLRPSTLGFNARGQASPGSLYLYRGRRGVRVVSNFLGRVRLERLSL